MLEDVEVKEIIAGKSSPEEILEIRKWMEAHQAKDQSIFPTGVVSLDVKEVRVMHYDWMKMTGELLMTTRSEPLKTYLAKVRISGFNEDKWEQLPTLIMIGNGTSWALMISLDLKVVSKYKYCFKKMIIQPELLDLLRDLPVCLGLGVKGDVHKIKQFYSKVLGINLEMAGFIDLSALALVADYQMNARGMTPIGVQVLGAIVIFQNCWKCMGWETSSLVT